MGARMIKIMNKNKKMFVGVFSAMLIIVIFSYAAMCLYSYSVISNYQDKMYPNVFVAEYDISNIKNKDIKKRVKEIKNNVDNKEISFLVNEKEYKYYFKDLGVSLDEDKLIDKVFNYSNNLGFFDKMNKILESERIVFAYEFNYNNTKLKSFLEGLKKKVDCDVTKGKLVMNNKRQLSYQNGQNGFLLDVDANIKLIQDNLYRLLKGETLTLNGKVEKPQYDRLSTIDTKVSSFSTKFDYKVSRGRNIETAANYLDGVIINSNETFSFYKYAGPYNKKGYVYYDGVVGNGVCQVASTIYNTELLAGMKTIERYSHANQMMYVEGGLDATVSAKKSGNRLDFKFKNVYNYPIYISAYVNKGTLTIEFWSNSKALEGKTYKTKSVKIGFKGYNTYLITYKNGKQTNKEFIATTWYPK